MPVPREGMMAVVRNRRAMITGVQPYDAREHGRYHLVEVEYTDGIGVETDQLLWEAELGTEVIEPSALPEVSSTPPMDPREFDAMVRAARWSALTPSLPFSGLDEDRPPLASPLYGAIHPEPYQLVPVLRALEMPRVALMLADAVGLGKTIQAGMVLRELMLRRRIRRVLVLCPAALRTQWREEMDEKFALPFEVVDRPSTLRLQREVGIDANPWRTHERIIASYHYLKQPDVLEQFRATAEPGEDGRLSWDLLIVDEAHNLAPASFGSDSDLSRTLQSIAPWFEHRLFLTATPHNGHTRSFSGLLEALDPIRFTRKSELNAEDRARVGQAVIRRLKSEINACYEGIGEPARFSKRHVEALPVLRFSRQELALQEAVRDFRKGLRRATLGADHQDRTAANFATEVLQKRLLSGPWAFGQSWLALMDGLHGGTGTSANTVNRAKAAHDDDTDNDNERESRQRHADRTVGEWLMKWQDSLITELAAVSNAVAALEVTRVDPTLEPAEHRADVAMKARKIKADARLQSLLALIQSKLRSKNVWQEGERIVVFTEYLATLDYLRATLQAVYGEGDWLLSLYGGMNDADRDAVKKAFNDPDGPARILLATDAAGEGLNLQRVARYLLHWDIPWNPGKMEQRNGRLDRHGQKRDVFVFHFDSTDDATTRFLGKVLAKRSQTREDRVVTDEIFADALLAHFEHDQEVDELESLIDRAIFNAKAAATDSPDDLPTGAPLPGAEDQARLERLKAELDLSPHSLRDTLETALAIEADRPRLKPDRHGRDQLVPPVPAQWNELIDHTLRDGGPGGALQALVFDPSHYVRPHDGTPTGRPVYTPESDSRLLHLGDALYHRVMSTFARYRFPGGPAQATRWTVRHGGVPDGADALVLLTVEELAVNELREPCHHWVRTVAFPVVDEELGEPLPPVPAASWSATEPRGDRKTARDLWDELDRDLKRWVKTEQGALTDRLQEQLKSSGNAVQAAEKKRFKARQSELAKAVKETALDQLRKEVERQLKDIQQQSLFKDVAQDKAKRLTDLQAEIQLRRTHYNDVMARLADERTRVLERVLPQRYKLRGTARLYPIAVELRLPGGDA